ncbi:hypothetical protein V6N13_109858 [Hibiscus sabdariffa]
MAEPLVARRQSGATAPVVVIGTEQEQGMPKITTVDGEKIVESRNLGDLYGPWMQVVNRRRRTFNSQDPNGVNGGTVKVKEVMGSRFVTLSTDNHDVVEVEVE